MWYTFCKQQLYTVIIFAELSNDAEGKKKGHDHEDDTDC